MNSRIQAITSEISHSLTLPWQLVFAIEIISNLQINDILLDNIFPKGDHSNNNILIKLGSYLSSLFGSFGLFDSDPDTLFLQTTWILFVCYLLMHIVLLVVLCTIPPKSKNRIITVLLKAASIVYLLHSRIILFIIQYFFMKVISLYNDCDLSNVDKPFPCSDAWYGFTIVFIVINCSLGLLKETILYEINPNKRNSYAIKNNLFHKSVFAHKVIAATIYFLMRDSKTGMLVNSGFNLCFIFLNLTVLFFKLPFYNLNLLKASIVTQAAGLSLSFISLLENAGVDQRVIVILCFIMPPLTIKALLILYHLFSQEIVQGKHITPERAVHLVMLLKKNRFGYTSPSIYTDMPHPGAIIANGIFVQQLAEVEKLNRSRNKREHEKLAYTHLVEKLLQILDKYPNSELLLLYIAHICLIKLDNIPKAIMLVRRVESLNISIAVKNSIDKFNNKLQKIHTTEYIDNDEDELNLFNYFKERKIAHSIKEKMLNEVRKHMEFWEELRKDKVDVKKVIDTAHSIEKLSNQIEEDWKGQIKGFTKHYLNPMAMYGAYLEIIKEHTDDARKLLKRFWSFTNDPHQDQILDVYSNKAAVIIISLEKTNLGQILDASGSTQALFEMEKETFMGNSLTTLLPNIVGESIIRFLDQYTKRPAEKLDYSIKTYARSSIGEYFEIGIELKLFPEVGRQVKGIAIFEKLSTSKPMVIVNGEGAIIECSESLKKTFYNQKQSDHHVALQQIVPEFDRVNTAFNQVYGGNPDLYDTSSKLSVHSRANDISNSTAKSGMYRRRLSRKISNDSFRKSKMLTDMAKQEDMEKRMNQKDHILPLDTLSQEDHHKICSEFTQGSKLRIIIDNLDVKYETEYDVQISPFVYKSEVYKILSLIVNQEKNVMSQQLFINEVEPSIIESNFASDFPEANERMEEPAKPGLFHLSRISSKHKSDNENRRMTLLSQERDTDEPAKRDNVLRPSNSLLKGPKQDTSNETPVQKAKLAPNRENSISSTSSRTIASIKALRTLFDQRQYYSLARKASLFLFATMTFIVILVGVGFFVSRAASRQVETGVNIINYANIRLSSALRGWQLSTRVFQLYRNLRTLNLANAKNNMYLRAQSMINQNTNLLESFGELDEVFARQLLKEDIQLWELYENGTTSVVKVNTFLATNILANKLFFIANATQDLLEPDMLREVQYLANNTCNDYFVYSEELIQTTQLILEELIKINISNLQLILSFELAGLAAVCFSVLLTMRIIMQSYKRLFKALTKIDEKNVLLRLHQLQKVRTVLSEDLDTKKFSHGTVSARKPVKRDHGKDKGKSMKKGFQKIEDRIDTKKLFLDVGRHVLVSLIVVQSITALCVTSLLGTISSFRSLEAVNRQLSVTTKSGYQTGAIISTFNAEMVWANETAMSIRNQSPKEQLVKFLDAIINVNVDLITIFSEEGVGITDPLIQELLETNVCQYLPASALTSCVTATTDGALGILGINSKLLMLAGTYIRLYLGDPTFDNVKTFVDPYATIMRPSADTLEEAYQFINTYILKTLSDDLDSFAMKTLALHLGIVLAVFISTVFVYYVDISRISTLDMCRGQILKVISFNILVGDKAVGFYLNNHFITMDNAISKML